MSILLGKFAVEDFYFQSASHVPTVLPSCRSVQVTHRLYRLKRTGIIRADSFSTGMEMSGGVENGRPCRNYDLAFTRTIVFHTGMATHEAVGRYLSGSTRRVAHRGIVPQQPTADLEFADYGQDRIRDNERNSDHHDSRRAFMGARRRGGTPRANTFIQSSLHRLVT